MILNYESAGDGLYDKQQSAVSLVNAATGEKKNLALTSPGDVCGPLYGFSGGADDSGALVVRTATTFDVIEVEGGSIGKGSRARDRCRHCKSPALDASAE